MAAHIDLRSPIAGARSMTYSNPQSRPTKKRSTSTLCKKYTKWGLHMIDKLFYLLQRSFFFSISENDY